MPVQLAGLAQTDCTDPPPAEPLTDGAWRLSAESAFTESASAAAGGFAYTAGGFGHADGLQRFDPATESHDILPAMPAERHHPMMASDGRHLYLAGGFTGRFGYVAEDNFWRFDPESSRWEILTDMPNARSGFAAEVVKGQIVVLGGERIDILPPQLIATAEVFAPGAEGWAAGPVSPIVVHGATGAVVDDRLILTAGSDEAGSLSTNRATQILELDAD